MTWKLKNRTAVVTGAARGIGLASAQRLVEDGCGVLLADIDTSVHERALELGQPAVTIDLAAPGAVGELFARADASFDHLDILVNSAGVSGRSIPFVELPVEEFRRIIEVNVTATLLATQEAARRMIPRSSGSIINLSSVGAVMATGDQVSYAVSKAAVKHLTAIAALALAPYGVRVNAVGPGPTETEMVAQFIAQNPEMRAQILARTPAGRLAETAEIASIIAFLASDDAAYLNGQTIFADGGRMALGYLVEKNARVKIGANTIGEAQSS